MSMIDTSDKSIKNSPFNDLSDGQNTPANPFEGFTVAKNDAADRLSTRSSVFMAFIAVAVCLLVPAYAGDKRAFLMSILTAAGAVAAYVSFWSVTFRFFENPDIMPASVVLNLIPAVLGSIFLPGLSFTGTALIGAGLTALSLMSHDELKTPARKGLITDPKAFKDVDFLNGEFIKYREFIKADVLTEITIPVVCALLSSVTGVVISSYIGRKTGASGRGLSILISSFVIVLISFAVSKIRGKDYLLSSSLLSDASVLPSVKFRSLRSFLLRRLRFFLSFILVGTGSLICDQLNVSLSLGLPFMKHAVGALMLFAFAFIRGRHSKHRIQFVTELCIIYALVITLCHSVTDLIILTLLTTMVDILISGMMITHNRRLIMSGRNRYLEGVPLELMSVAIIYMSCEVLFQYWGIVI